MPLEEVFDTDVLIVGGGAAALVSAIKAKEKGVDVILVDKGYAGKSGQTPYATFFAVFNPEWGHNLDDWMNQATISGEYLNDRDWIEIVLKESYDIYGDFVSWGVKFITDQGKPFKRRIGVSEMFLLDKINFSQAMRKHAVKIGVKVIDRVVVAELLKQGETVAGAVGIPMDKDCLYILKAKSTILCTGGSSFKPAGWPVYGLTSDGDAMAYRAGAEITGKEFIDTHPTRADFPAYSHHISEVDMTRFPKPGAMINAEGKEVQGAPSPLKMEFEAHAGQAPLFVHTNDLVDAIAPIGQEIARQEVDREAEKKGLIRRIGGAASGMSVHKAEGIWPVDNNCASGIPGLYAAGDCLGTMQAGAAYGLFGTALLGSAVTGARAGKKAAEYALHIDKSSIDDEKLAKARTFVIAPLGRKGGFSPRWVTQLLQNIMIPYFIMYIKHGDRMQAALTMVEFMQKHLVPRLYAKDPHDLRLAHETKNMILNAEMKLKASLFRKESRGSHYREDFPRRDDPNWLVWVTLKDENGQMIASRKPIPEEWWPDLSKSYEDRYAFRFPGE